MSPLGTKGKRYASVPGGPCRAILGITWQSWMAARSFFFLLAFGWMMPPLVSLFVWRAVAVSGSVGGMGPGGITTYYLAVIVVNQFTMTQANWTVGDNIREGHFSTLLLRPFHPLLDAAMVELAGKAVFLTFSFPIAVILAVVLGPVPTFRLSQVVTFVPALMLGWLLRFSWGLSLALLAFRFVRSDSLFMVQEILVQILGGILAPVRLLPRLMHDAARILPFRLTVGFPVEVLTGALAPREVIAGFCAQIAWLALSCGTCAIAWRSGISRHEAVGA